MYEPHRSTSPVVPLVVVADLLILFLFGLLVYGCAGGPTHAHAQQCLARKTVITPAGRTSSCILALTDAAQARYRSHVAPDGSTALLNDLAVTPGDVGALTAAQLCDPAFHTRSLRNVSAKTKHLVCAQYGIAKADCNGRNFEIDHLVSLELGGSNDARNLWPQPYAPAPAAHEKDIVENWLHRQVCSGAVTLADAQKAIATDWYAVLLLVPESEGGPTIHMPPAPAPAPDTSRLPNMKQTQRDTAPVQVGGGDDEAAY